MEFYIKKIVLQLILVSRIKKGKFAALLEGNPKAPFQ